MKKQPAAAKPVGKSAMTSKISAPPFARPAKDVLSRMTLEEEAQS